MCYCKTSGETLSASIQELIDKIPQIEAKIAEAEAFKVNVEAELKKHKEDRAAAKEAIESATAQREKEAAEFDKVSGDLKANIAACDKAITAISKGMGLAFLQSGAAATLSKLALSSKLDRYSRDTLTA